MINVMRYALAAGALALGCAVAPSASAMAAPARPLPAATALTAPRPLKKAPAFQKRAPLYTLTVSPTQSFPTASDELVPGGTASNNQMFVDGSLFINVAPRVRIFEKMINHADVGGARYKNGRPDYGGFGRDTENQEGLSWDFARDLSLDLAYRERHRVCCPAATDVKSGRYFTGVLGGITYTFGPRTRIGKPFKAYAEETFVNHHLVSSVKIPKGQSDFGKRTLFKGSIAAQFELFGQQRVVPWVEYQNFSTIFDNNLVPSHTNRSIVGLQIKGTRYVSYKAYMKNDHQYGAGADVPHSVNLYLTASFKFTGE